MNIKKYKRTLEIVNSIGILLGIGLLIAVANTSNTWLVIFCIVTFSVSSLAGIIAGHLKRKYFPEEIKAEKMMDDSREDNWREDVYY